MLGWILIVISVKPEVFDKMVVLYEIYRNGHSYDVSAPRGVERERADPNESRN
jgi:hypothetical protein